MSAVDRDPYPANNFEVDLGTGLVGFAEVSGLGYEIEYFDEPARDRRAQPVKRVIARATEVTLRRGITGDAAVWRWVQAVIAGADKPRTVTIRLLDARREPACAWMLHGARPIRWTGPTLSALGTAVAMEELVLLADSIDFSAA